MKNIGKLQSIQIAAVLLAAITITSATCTAGGYAAASRDYDARSLAYKAAGDQIQNMRGVGRVNDGQWMVFEAAQAEVRAADVLVNADLTAWRDSKKVPAGYEINAKALRDAQNKVIALAAEVKL